MATVTKKMSSEAIQSLYNKVKPISIRETKPDYTYWQLKTSEVTITAYQSGKVVFQGKDVSWLIEDEKEDSKTKKDTSKKSTQKNKSSIKSNSKSSSKLHNVFPQAGSDEVGTGDYLGPLVVAAAIVPDEQTAQKLEALHITDSKAMTDETIRKVGPSVAQMIPYTVITLSNEKYNEIYDSEKMNLNKLKALSHNQAYLSLQKKGYEIPPLAVVDQFCTTPLYFSYLQNAKIVFKALHFETKAESKYMAVAAASVLARYTFLKAMDELEKKFGLTFVKGGGDKATQSAREFVKIYGRDQLKYIAKLHFVNTSRL